ncbi:hypothetical protein [Nocardia sp. N2S4-5]|uniref:hypothetical protein n=1 Tax=Nocardia sp. N2S4-5 TaxID=3351565 RepID=UPI0037D3D87C
MIVDWQTYYDAAKKCHDLADELGRADKPVHDAVKGECAGMAGDAPGCRQWGEAYDKSAQQTLQTCSSLANALNNYGAVLAAMGYNYAVANKSNPAPPRPNVTQFGEYKVAIPTSVANNGVGFTDHGGVKAFFDQLVADVIGSFGKLPNSDTRKLAKAHSVWNTFANHETIKGAPGRIAAISALFDGMDAGPNRQLIQDHFATLKTSADTVALAGGTMAAPVKAYHDASITLGNETTKTINTLELTIAVTAIVGGALALFSLGTSAAAATAAIEADVLTTVNAIQATYRASQMTRVIGLTALAAGGIGVIDAFNALPTIDLDKAITNLATIIAMKVVIDDGDDHRGDGATANGGAAVPEPVLDAEGEKYVRSKHFAGGAQVDESKGLFEAGENLDALVEASDSAPAMGPNKDGHYERTIDAGRIVGTTSASQGGRVTSRYIVVQDRWGSVRSMYPVP